MKTHIINDKGKAYCGIKFGKIVDDCELLYNEDICQKCNTLYLRDLDFESQFIKDNWKFDL